MLFGDLTSKTSRARGERSSRHKVPSSAIFQTTAALIRKHNSLSTTHLMRDIGVFFGVMLVVLLLAYPYLSVTQAKSIAGFTPGADTINSIEVQARYTPADDSLFITENYQIHVTGKKIKHGIYRVLPKSISIPDGEKLQYLYKRFSASRVPANAPEGTEPTELLREGSVEHQGDLVKLKLGSEEEELSPGTYDFTVSYEVRGAFEKKDGKKILRWVVNNESDLATAGISFSLLYPNEDEYGAPLQVVDAKSNLRVREIQTDGGQSRTRVVLKEGPKGSLSAIPSEADAGSISALSFNTVALHQAEWLQPYSVLQAEVQFQDLTVGGEK